LRGRSKRRLSESHNYGVGVIVNLRDTLQVRVDNFGAGRCTGSDQCRKFQRRFGAKLVHKSSREPLIGTTSVQLVHNDVSAAEMA
jgi:hypothetical protein